MTAAWPIPTQEQAKARSAVNNAVRAGKLPRVSTQLCVDCNEQADDYDHHNGYNNLLDVVPRCRPCHNNRHAERELATFPLLTARRRRRWEKRRKRWKEWYATKWYPQHREERRKYQREYYLNHNGKNRRRRVKDATSQGKTTENLRLR